MGWSEIRFGKHAGTTLPHLVFRDPDYFFWACEKGVFAKHGLGGEAERVYERARAIRVPQDGKIRRVAEYCNHPPTGKFGGVELVPESRPAHKGATVTWRRPVLDLAMPREIAQYDKLGGKEMVKAVKEIVFGSSSHRLTRKRCEAFFDDDDNFDL